VTGKKFSGRDRVLGNHASCVGTVVMGTPATDAAFAGAGARSACSLGQAARPVQVSAFPFGDTPWTGVAYRD